MTENKNPFMINTDKKYSDAADTMTIKSQWDIYNQHRKEMEEKVQ